jgi:hypothetical protein
VTRALRFTKSELENAAKLCREHGVVVKLAKDGSMLVFPDTHRAPTLDVSEDELLDAQLAAFEAEHGDD